MADFNEMRRLLDKMNYAEAGLSIRLMKVNESIDVLRESGEEVANRICNGALDGKTIGDWLFKRTEFQYNEDDEGWDCAYMMQTELSGVNDVVVGSNPGSIDEPPSDIESSVNYTMAISVYAIFGDNKNGGYSWYGEIQHLELESTDAQISDYDYDVEVEGEGAKPLEALKMLMSNIDNQIDSALNSMTVTPPESYMDSRYDY